MLAPTAVAGGAEEVLVQLAALLPARGLDVDAVALRNGPMVERLRQAGVSTTVLSTGRLRQVHRVIGTAMALHRIIKRGGYDLVCSNMATAHIYAAMPAKMAGVKAVWFQTGIPDPPALFDRVACALPADGAIAVSREAAEAQRRMKRPGAVYLMHPGVDTQRFAIRSDPELRAQRGIPADVPLVTIVGRLQPWKGQMEFLRAAAEVHSACPDCRFAVVGGAILGWEGDYSHQLEERAKGLGIAGEVVFTGHTSEVNRWMAASDVVVNASDREPFGLVVIEALACGCAVVAVNRGGPRDVIVNEEHGLLVPSREPLELAAAIRRLVADSSLRHRLGQGGRALVEQRFTSEHMTDRFIAIAEKVLTGSMNTVPAS
jgi:glycosyltransferase involved in cell wall biosynthesis